MVDKNGWGEIDTSWITMTSAYLSREMLAARLVGLSEAYRITRAANGDGFEAERLLAKRIADLASEGR